MPTSDTSFGFPYTVDPGVVRYLDNLPMPAANTAIYARVRDGGPVSKIGVGVATSGGNMSVAVYRNSGKGRSAVPGARIATSGSVTVPAAGYVEISLGQSIRVRPGDWFAISADGGVATFRSLLAAGADFGFGNGRQYRQATAHPLPVTPSGLVATTGYTFVLVGVR